MIKIFIDYETFNEAFKTYCEDLYTDELLTNSFRKVLDKLGILYPIDKLLNDSDINNDK